MKDLSTYDFLNSIRNNIATAAAMGCAYENWSDEYSRKNVSEAWSDKEGTMRSQVKRRVTKDEFNKLTDMEKTLLGFSMWDENGPRLIPLWAFNYIADGEELTAIDGDKVVKGKDDIDLDVRCSCIAFGFSL